MLSQRKERLFQSDSMSQEASQAKVRRGGDNIMNEPVGPIGATTMHQGKTVYDR